jgi:Fe2+ or Zn2+ uptake regulation protein
MPDGRILVCNDCGDIFLLESGGEFKYHLTDENRHNFKIENIMMNSRGFVVCGEFG